MAFRQKPTKPHPLHKFAPFAGGIVEDAMRDPFIEHLRHFYETSRAELYM